MSKCKYDKRRCVECPYDYCVDEDMADNEDTMTTDDIRSLIYTILDKYHVSQVGLGRMLGLSKSRVSYWVTGKYKPRPEYLQKLLELAEEAEE